MQDDNNSKVDNFFAFLGEDASGAEHIMEAMVGDRPMPLISRDVEALIGYKEIASQAAAQHGFTVRLVCWTNRRDIHIFKPRDIRSVPSTENSQTEHDAECRVDSNGQCEPCMVRLKSALDTVIEYFHVIQRQKEQGKICPLCERDLADGAFADLIEGIGASRKSRTEFLQSAGALKAVFQQKLNLEEWPKTDAAIKKIADGLTDDDPHESSIR